MKQTNIKGGIDIKPLDNQFQFKTTLVPNHPFTMIINGSKSAGKSTLLLNMLTSPKIYAGVFNRIVWFSPTAELDEKIHILTKTNIVLPNVPLAKAILKNKRNNKLLDQDDNNKVIEPYANVSIDLTGKLKPLDDEDFVSDLELNDLVKIGNSQRKIIKKYSKELADKILIVFDDLAGSNVWNKPLIQKYFFNSRHLNISAIITSQSFNKISKSIRNQNTATILFETGNINDIDNMYDENNVNIDKKTWFKIYYEVVNEPFGFLLVNHKNPVGYKLQNQFKNFIQVHTTNDEDTSNEYEIIKN